MSWLCHWCSIYGCYPLSNAYRPDSEEAVITDDGKMICQRCADKYWAAKAAAEEERRRAKARSKRHEN
jgi:hypothetical protein